MGLDVTYDAWHGAYSRFSRFRLALAKADGVPTQPSNLTSTGEIWVCPESHRLSPLLNHSDCDGEIEVEDLLPLAEALEELAPKLDVYEEGFSDRALQFAEGCRAAYADGVPLEFQ